MEKFIQTLLSALVWAPQTKTNNYEKNDLIFLLFIILFY